MVDDLNITRAFNLLREATNLLSGSAESSTQGSEVSRNVNANVESTDSSLNTANGSNTFAPSGPGPSSGVQPCQSTPINNHQNAVLRSFQSLFSPYSRGNTSSLGLSGGTGCRPIRNNRRHSRQRQQHAASSRQGREETWTHEVFCLASSSQQVVPNRDLKKVLQRAGLGRMKMHFNAKGDPQSFKETLDEAFPKLTCDGGFELLRRGTSGSQLVLLQPPAIGYSVQFLKTSSGIGQAVIYVRPIQCDLDTSTTSEANEEDMENEVKYFIKLY